MGSQLRVERLGAHEEILVMTLDKPERRNAIDQGLAEEIEHAMQTLETVPGLRVGILTGAGGFFSAGTDLASEEGPSTPAGGPYGFVRRQRTRPLIAAVEGFALGGGFEMVMATDLVVASKEATFGLPETLRGVVANCGALFRGPLQLTPNLAMELLLTGQRLSAQRAHEIGFVNRLAEPGAALTTAIEFAEEIVLGSPAAVAASMRAIATEQANHETPLWDLTETAAEEAANSPDRKEGIAAFFEKRTPRWT